MSTHKRLEIYIDGSSLGNPGDAGVGVVIAVGQHPLKNISQPIGLKTNNVAEYTALIISLKEALSLGAAEIDIFSDSELLCRQMNGVYKVKNETIKSLFLEALGLIKSFKSVHIQQIPRERNKGADKLARLAAKKQEAINNPK
jgi:ribonuclease HI